LAATNSKQRSALLHGGGPTIISNVPLGGCPWLCKGEGLYGGSGELCKERVSLWGRAWLQLACSQWSHWCQMVSKYKQAQPSLQEEL